MTGADTDSTTWTVLGSRQLYRDRWLDVRADHCVTARGAVLDPYYVLHYPDWANIVAITPDGLIVLVRQYRHGSGEFVLELPGGVIDGGEAPADAAERELAEETGYRAAAIKPVCAFATNPATHTNRIHTFLARDARQSQPRRLDAGEDIEIVLHRPAELLAMVQTGVAFRQAMQVGPLMLALEIAGLLRIIPAA